MKCIGYKCDQFSNGHDYGCGWCNELELGVEVNNECELPNKIKEDREDLLRKCELLENILEMGNDSLDDLINKME